MLKKTSYQVDLSTAETILGNLQFTFVVGPVGTLTFRSTLRTLRTRGGAARLRRDEVLALASREDLAVLVEAWRKLEQVGTEKKSPEETRNRGVRGRAERMKAGK